MEAVKGYGLLRRRQWAEYLTVVASALLFVPEVQELLKHPTGLKVGGLLLNVLIVVYLIIRLIRRRDPAEPRRSSADSGGRSNRGSSTSLMMSSAAAAIPVSLSVVGRLALPGPIGNGLITSRVRPPLTRVLADHGEHSKRHPERWHGDSPVRPRRVASPGRDGDVDTWRAFEKLRDDGRARSIGVSNFTTRQLDLLAGEASTVPAVNQVELNPWKPQYALREYHQRAGIATEAWAPLAEGGLLDDLTVRDIARRRDRTPAQVVLRWHLQVGNIVFPKSVTAARIRENIDIADFELSTDEMAAIDALRR